MNYRVEAALAVPTGAPAAAPSSDRDSQIFARGSLNAASHGRLSSVRASCVLDTVALSLSVVTLNRIFWRPLYARAELNFRIALALDRSVIRKPF